jgi:uncharacterized protein (DUF1501 family)
MTTRDMAVPPRANTGTRFIFIAHNFSPYGWDLHDKLYDKTANQYNMCQQLDAAIASLLDDLEAETDEKGRRLIDKTFLICMGEFGRTPGDPKLRGGRDHYRYAVVALFAGAHDLLRSRLTCSAPSLAFPNSLKVLEGLEDGVNA